MLPRFALFLLAGLSTMWAASTGNIVVNGDFQTSGADGVPDWTVVGDPSTASIKEEGGDRFLRINLSSLAYVNVIQSFPVAKNWTGLEISARLRAKGLVKGPEGHNTMTLLYMFEDETGKNVGGWPQHMVTADQDWTDIRETVKTIPYEAATLKVMCAMMNAAGTADFDNISITPVLGAERTPPPKPVEKREGKVGVRGNLLENSDFSAAAGAGVPPGWQGTGDANRISVMEEGGSHFLRLALDKPDFLTVSQKFNVAPDWKGVRISARIRVEGLQKGPEPYNTATLLYVFDNAKGEHVGNWFQTMILQDQPWTDIKDHIAEIPEGASTFTVQAAFMNGAGRADFTNLKVEPELIGDLPAGVVLAGGEPVEDEGFGYARICLNGVWQFQPALGADAPESGKDAWGLIRVPGTWAPWPYGHEADLVPGVVATGSGKAWKDWDGSRVARAWYERKLDIPKDWRERSILLDLTRVSTDAEVFIDGKKAGGVTWPGGLVDLTSFVKPGSSYVLRVLVTSVHDKDKTLNAMGVGQNTLVDAKLSSRGIIGEAFLVSRPEGARIDGVWVRTSVRKKELTVEADLTGIRTAGSVDFKAEIRDAGGKVVKTFDGKTDVAVGDSTVSFTWPWADPKLWDVGQPNLYTLDLSARGAGLEGGFRQTFGFREVWIENRTIFLNGTPFRLRPINTSALIGNPAISEAEMKNMLASGFNIAEIWPADYTERGSVEFSALISEIADRVGLPIMGQTRHAGALFDGWVGLKWEDPKLREDWLRLMKAEWKTVRNNPSIVMWSSSGNISGHVDDQDPRRLGRGLDTPIWQLSSKEGNWNRNLKLEEFIKTVKDIDPTRPYMIHQGGASGDVYSVNNYLCLIPLQEREEWLSDWAEHGNKPFCSIEFGTPLSTTMHRGRDGFFFSTQTEPLATEFTAAYLGRDAYALERPAYREAIVAKYAGGQVWNWPDKGFIEFEPGFQDLEKIFVGNTWRSWRTMGVTAGMIPWAKAHGFEDLKGTVDAEPFKPGQRGMYVPVIEQRRFTPVGGVGVKTHPSGETLLANNAPTLAWIAGPKVDGDIASFTQKDHTFRAGETIHKQVAILNDSREEQPWSVAVTAQLDGKTLGTVEKSGRIPVGQTVFVPLDFAVPAGIAAKQQGEIKLDAKIGANAHADRFAFHAFPAAKPLSGKVAVFDPEGDTTRLLQSLGLTVSPWKGEAAETLVVGRRALSSGAQPPASLEDYVKNGGRLLIMTQDPEWLKDFLGLRVSGIMSRRIFRMDPAHPVSVGLDEADLRDWRGASTLLEPKPDYTQPGIPRNVMPTWGWRWGGRGTVSSATVEKPHRSGWRPLMEGEFDLAYSPLMELDFGKGRVLFTTFDLEDHAALDPAADQLARNIVSYVMTAPLAPPPVEALYVGNDDGAALLDLIGANYRRASAVEAAAPLVILGPDISADVASPVLEKGGRVLVLPRRAVGSAGLGLEVIKQDVFGGSLQVPDWSEARGLSPADLRRRADGPALLLKGPGTAADGLLARLQKGQGVAVFAQLDPLTTPADEKVYLRFTRWHETRTLAQLLANLGGSFAMDRHIFVGGTSRIKLDGPWKVIWTRQMPSSATPFPDPGYSEKAQAHVKAEADESGMQEVILPTYWKEMENADGEAVFRRKFQVPAKLAGQELLLNIGVIDDFDEIYVNGVKVGSTDANVPKYYSVERHYRIPAGVLKEGENVIAVRVFDNFGGGGFGGAGGGMAIVSETEKDVEFYHPDYRSDFRLGDDPYRYYRW